MAVLEVTDLVVRHAVRGQPPVQAVNGVNLRVDAGRIVGLVGESGCGKSSLARVAVGLAPPSAGNVSFRGRPVRPVGWRRRSRDDAGLQMVFQDPYGSLNPRRRIGSQLVDGAPERLTAEARRRFVGELLERVGMDVGVADRYPHEFSGGQRQRLAIARALAAEPAIIIADEPVTALDASSQAQIVNLLVGLVRDLGLGMLFISHDLALVRQIADETAVMYLGRIVEQAATTDLWERPRHPYTDALVGAVPEAQAGAKLPATLPGEVPDPTAPPSGCHFRPRCPLAVTRCEEPPPLLRLGNRRAACWLADESTHDAGPTDHLQPQGR